MNDREQYYQKMQQELEAWGVDLSKLKAKGKSAGEHAQADMKKRLDLLEHNLDDARTRLKHFYEASGDAGNALKDGMDAAWESLKSGFHEAAEKYK